MFVRLGVLAAAFLVLVACSDDEGSPSTTVARPSSTVTSTTRPPTTTVRPVTTTTTTIAATTTAAPTTTTVSATTVPPASELTLRGDGLGVVRFGADAEAVVQYVAGVLGPPTTDSQWVPAFGQFGSCPGTEVRGITWGDLTLMFGDTSDVAADRRHFFAYAYGPAFGQSIDPAGMHTDAGIGVGATVAQLKAAHRNVVVSRGDQVTPPSFRIGETLHGTITGTSDADVVQAFVGGTGCGE